jgi:hypothetical protein
MQEFDEELFRTDTTALNNFNKQIIDEFYANDGKVGGVFEEHHVPSSSCIENPARAVISRTRRGKEKEFEFPDRHPHRNDHFLLRR